MAITSLLQTLLQVMQLRLVNQMTSLAGADKAEADPFHLLASCLKPPLLSSCHSLSMRETR